MNPVWDPPRTADEVRRQWEYHESTICPECGRGSKNHWPFCSEAPIENQIAYARSDELRKLRAARRVGE